MNHRCKSSSPRPKTKSVNSHRRFQKLRLDIIVRDYGECVRCRVLFNKSTRETPDQPLQCHHIKPQSLPQYEHLKWEPTNLIMLCQECHDVYDNGKVHELDFEYEIPPLFEY
ncbi:HNH endonuclease [Cytobacillus praedii]|uniref:HNH endonuclease n=1 Tax=Cytobacillus praedii TaxID=1742358 RepID=UPI00399C7DF6